MGIVTNISWARATWSGWWGCNHVSPGCDHCYMDTLVHRWGWGGEKQPEIMGPPRETTRRLFGAKHWTEPLMWNSQAKARNERWPVFPSMCDPFEFHPLLNEPRQMWWDLILKTDYLDWQLLTKRPQLIHKMVPPEWLEPGGWPRNGWLGVTAEDQEWWDRRVPIITGHAYRDVPVIFVSYEPALGRVDPHFDWMHPQALARLWIICGGESGAGYRPMEEEWALHMRDECAKYGVVFHFKQHSGFRAGMGPRLEGVIHHAMPHVDGVPGVLTMNKLDLAAA
jgi:protein gp37